MRMVSIASGSSGNCIYIGSESTHILVDAGISNKRIEQGLNEIGLKGGEMDGILITHEHSDHIKGLGVLSRKHHLPIYGTPRHTGANRFHIQFGGPLTGGFCAPFPRMWIFPWEI